MNAIENGKRDIRTEADFNRTKVSNGKNGDAKVNKKQETELSLSIMLNFSLFQVHMTEANLKSTYEKNEKFADNLNGSSKALLPVKIVNDIMKGDENIAINVEEREPDNTTALLGDETGNLSPERYPTSEFHQFWVVLKRTLLFSRRDWVNSKKVQSST